MSGDQFEIVDAPMELSDGAVRALARWLLSIDADPSEDEGEAGEESGRDRDDLGG